MDFHIMSSCRHRNLTWVLSTAATQPPNSMGQSPRVISSVVSARPRKSGPSRVADFAAQFKPLVMTHIAIENPL